MNTQTGEIRVIREIEMMDEIERKNWIPVTRDLTVKEKFDAQIKLYSLCGCGSGKKFKFCCYKKQ